MPDKKGNKTGSNAGGNIVGGDAKSPQFGQKDSNGTSDRDSYSENSESDNNQAQKRFGG